MTTLQAIEADPTTAPISNLGAFLRAFLECGIWSNQEQLNGEDLEDEDERELYESYAPADIDLIPAESHLAAVGQCRDFIRIAVLNGLLPSGTNTELYSQAGHDFWLTRNGHGTGFWDRGNLYGKKGQGKKLASLCDTFSVFPDVDLERGDDGLVHLYPRTITRHSGYTAPEGIKGLETLDWLK